MLKVEKSFKPSQVSGKSQRGEKWAQKSIGKLNHANLQKKNIQEVPKNKGKESSQIQSNKRKLNQKEKLQKRNCFAIIEEENSKSLRIQPGESKQLKLRFKFRPEYLVEGQRIIIDDNCVKCFGFIRKVLNTSLRT